MENNLPIRTNTENSPAPMVMLVPVGQQAYKPNNKHYTNMKHLATIRAFSGLAIAFGILSIALQIAALCTNYPYYSYDVIGHGIWAGSFYIVAGGLGLGSASKRTRGLIVSTVVFGSLSIVASLTATILSVLSASYAYCYYRNCYQWHGLEWGLMATSILALCDSITLTVLMSIVLCKGRPKFDPQIMIQPSPYTGFPQGNVQFMTGMNYSGQTFTPVYMAGMQAPVQPFQYQLTAGANAQQIIGQQSHQANNSAKVPEA